MLSARRIQRFLAVARREAMKSSMKFRHGAVLVKGGRVVGSGFNQDRTCLNGLFVTSVHAEINALKDKTLTATTGTSVRSDLVQLAEVFHDQGPICTSREYQNLGLEIQSRALSVLQRSNASECGACSTPFALARLLPKKSEIWSHTINLPKLCKISDSGG